MSRGVVKLLVEKTEHEFPDERRSDHCMHFVLTSKRRALSDQFRLAINRAHLGVRDDMDGVRMVRRYPERALWRDGPSCKVRLHKHDTTDCKHQLTGSMLMSGQDGAGHVRFGKRCPQA